MQRAFTLIELLVVMTVIAILASVILVAVTQVGLQAKKVQTMSLIQDFDVGVQKFQSNLRRHPFTADANGDFNPDDCWRALAPHANSLTSGIQPGQPGYLNANLLDCLGLQSDQMHDLNDGKSHVVDAWKKPFSMQWDWFNRKAMIWSAGPDLTYDISDNNAMGGHSGLFATQAQALAQNPPPITQVLLDSRFDPDLNNR